MDTARRPFKAGTLPFQSQEGSAVFSEARYAGDGKQVGRQIVRFLLLKIGRD